VIRVTFKNAADVLCSMLVKAKDNKEAKEIVIRKEALFGNTVKEFVRFTKEMF
jgi:hypothetical protein